MSKKPLLMIVEDDIGIREQLKWCFEEFEVIQAGNREEAIGKLRRFDPAIITLDLGLPPDIQGVEEGLATLNEILRLKSTAKVIMVTGQSDRTYALQAINQGAYDFYIKPIDKDELNFIANRAYYLYQLETENKQIQACHLSHKVPQLYTSSQNMLQVCKTIEKVASTDISVLLLGESGTGKEVLAKGLHQLSARKDKPFIAINCAAIPENLLESELFGYEKGAFTGAVKQTLGKIELAQEGTLFLDEIGDLPSSLQPKLLRFLQERCLERLGGRKEIIIDVRIICATHKNLEELMRTQQFREDLFYRLSEVIVKIPPLQERAQDALILAQLFMRQFAKLYNPKVKGFSESAKQVLCEYNWPGNIRELENKIKRAVVMAEGNQIQATDLDILEQEQSVLPFNLKEVRLDAERKAIIRALHFAQGNMSKAAELLGITRPTLYHIMEKLKIKELIY